MLFPFSTFGDPCFDELDFCCFERGAVFRLGHHFLGIFAADATHDIRGIGFSWHDGDLPRFGLHERAIPINERKSARFFNPAMAGCAILQEDGTDIAIKAYLIGLQIEADVIQANYEAGYLKYFCQNDARLT